MDEYFAAIDAVEWEWWSSELPAWQAGTGGRIIGASPWHNNRAKLAEIDFRHGITPGDPRVYSIRGYKADFARLKSDWHQECKHNGWTSRPVPDAPDFPAFWTAEYRSLCRRGDLDARHFGRLPLDYGHETESPRHLWAHITMFALTMLETLPSAKTNLRSVDPILQRVYSALHEMRIQWADSPPYHPLTRQESIDKLRQIANRLEADEADGIRQREYAAVDSSAIQSEAVELERFLAWLDEFTLATTNRVVENSGTQSFDIDLNALNRLLPSAADHATCLEVVTAQEFVSIMSTLHRYVATVVASTWPSGAWGQEPTATDVMGLNEAVHFAVPYVQRLAVQVRTGKAAITREPALQCRYNENSLPAEYREGGKSDGKPLVTDYLAAHPDWKLNGGQLSGARQRGAVKSVKVTMGGKLKSAHEYQSLAAYQRSLNLRETNRDNDGH